MVLVRRRRDGSIHFKREHGIMGTTKNLGITFAKLAARRKGAATRRRNAERMANHPLGGKVRFYKETKIKEELVKGKVLPPVVEVSITSDRNQSGPRRSAEVTDYVRQGIAIDELIERCRCASTALNAWGKAARGVTLKEVRGWGDKGAMHRIRTAGNLIGAFQRARDALHEAKTKRLQILLNDTKPSVVKQLNKVVRSAKAKAR
jgi:hypothetical protein